MPGFSNFDDGSLYARAYKPTYVWKRGGSFYRSK